MSNMSRLYNFGHGEKMSVPVATPPSPPQSLSDNDLNGPYYNQYWSLITGTVEHDGIPISTNGTYMTPYGTAAVPEAYFNPAGIQEDGLPHLEEINPWSGVNACSDPLFTHSRSTSYGLPESHHQNHPYHTPPMDGVGWQTYSDPMTLQQSVPALNNLANQILSTLISGTAQDFVNTVSSSEDTDKGQAYHTVVSLFEQTRRIFTHGAKLIIDPSELPVTSSAFFNRVVRKANLATFVISIFRGQNIPFLELDESFLDIFMPPGSRLLKSEGGLFLELKTQAFIAIMHTGGFKKEDLLDKLFPRDRGLELAILRRRSEPTHLAPSEADFISRAQTRRTYLSQDATSVESLARLPQKYNWKAFLEEVAVCVRRVMEGLDSSKDAVANSMLSVTSAPEDPITKATLAAHAAISGHSHHRSLSMNALNTSSSPFAPQLMFGSDGSPSSLASGRSFRSGTTATGSSPSTPESLSMPFAHHARTSHPTSSPSKGAGQRRANPPSQRRPWTQDEEKALLDGLERVKGPHWSQILALYGAGGSIAETLKDRNQVQLKDKARNLKLFFLKSGVEVPGYLKRVTGELRTRAPGQMARRERERERARREEEERQRRDREAAQVAVA
jgi:protein TBF1